MAQRQADGQSGKKKDTYVCTSERKALRRPASADRAGEKTEGDRMGSGLYSRQRPTAPSRESLSVRLACLCPPCSLRADQFNHVRSSSIRSSKGPRPGGARVHLERVSHVWPQVLRRGELEVQRVCLEGE